MITIKTDREIELMYKAGQVAAEALALGGENVKPGVTTKHINDVMERFIKSKGGIPSFKGYGGFPATACISINNQVIHGIPSANRVIADGDIVSIDVGVLLNGYHGDTARTYGAGNISKEAQRLIDVTKQSFFEGIKYADPTHRLGDISHAIQEHVENAGFSVVKEFVGHGVGSHLHEDPEVPNYGRAGRGTRLYEGMTLAIEPMVNFGTADVSVLDNDWTVVTDDGMLSAHYENSILITANGPEILTIL